MNLTLVTPPPEEPVTLAELKLAARIVADQWDSLLSDLIVSARQLVELKTRRQLVTATWRADLNGFGGLDWLPKPPLQSVSAITYPDGDGTTQTLATSVYEVLTPEDGVGLVRLKYQQAWPTPRGDLGGVRVTFVAGYGLADRVPPGLKTAIKFLAIHWFDNPGLVSASPLAEIPDTVAALISPFRFILPLVE